jgi:hypothetical protein
MSSTARFQEQPAGSAVAASMDLTTATVSIGDHSVLNDRRVEAAMARSSTSSSSTRLTTNASAPSIAAWQAKSAGASPD